MGIKMIVSDIDGTLIDHTERIFPELKAFVLRCREHGIHFTFATGRTKELAAHLVEELGISDPYVIANGACIFRGEECLLAHGFSALPVLFVLKRADELGLTVTIADTKAERAVRETDYVKEHQKHGNRYRELIDLNTVDFKRQTFQKIMFMDEHKSGKIEEVHRLLKGFESQYWITTYSNQAVELGPLGCNKASGVRELAALMGISMDEIMACGDFYNDMEMIREAGIGVAVANANDSLKQAADYTAKASYAFGVIEAAEKYCF